MTRQADAFFRSEGREWWERNKDKIDVANDPILKMVEDSGIKPERVLEIGCADGWRLRALRDRYGCQISGIDPYDQNEYIEQGEASDLIRCFDNEYDLVIYGFCLYLCDREDLFRIAMEGDRVLSDGGHMIIWDFYPVVPHKRGYAHHSGLHSYKMYYPHLWTGNPAYYIKRAQAYNGDDLPNTRTVVTLLKKDMEAAWPLRSF